MYSEQMMREHGFDDGPAFRVSLYTDAVWRACRIILDVRMHRGEIGVDDAIDFLVEQTGFERPNARAEVHRYTYTPTYQMSYLLGKVMLLGLRSDEQRRLGDCSASRPSTTPCSVRAASPSASSADCSSEVWTGWMAARTARTTPAPSRAPRHATDDAHHPVARHRGGSVAPRVLAGCVDRRRQPDRSAGESSAAS